MTASLRAHLRDCFVADYNELFRRLMRRLGSRDLTLEVLHETYCRIDGIAEGTAVQSPRDYFFRAAINVAKNKRRAENYRSGGAVGAAFIDVVDDAPDPARVVEGRSEIDALKAAMMELPKRQRIILSGVAIEGRSVSDTAERLGVSVRTVEMDFKKAVEYCAKRLDRKITRRLGGPRLKV